jgi:hypothetical protein
MPVNGLKNNVRSALISLMLLLICGEISSQNFSPDSVHLPIPPHTKSEDFYDSLKVRASRKNFYRLIYDAIVTGHKPVTDSKSEAISYYSAAEGKTIGKIQFLRLEVFGPTVQDTARKAKSAMDRIGNSMHTRSDLNNLRKNLIIKQGDIIDPEILYENERIFRTLSRIRDARFVLIPDTLNPEKVDLLLITQDRFSIGVSGVVEGTNSAKGQIYNRNFFGLGHEISVSLVGHLTRQPYLGFESFYKINNINGRFLNFSAGYYNTYRNEGASLLFEKPLIRISDKWAYGVEGYTFRRTDELPELIREYRDAELQYNQMNLWGARNLQLGNPQNPHSQLTLSMQYFDRHFQKRPLPFPGEDQYFAHSRALFGGVTWSQRSYNPDLLIYGYGITEDIPKGFKNEIAVGFDNNENGDRLYGHLLFSNGNFLRNKPGYLYVYGGISSYYSHGKVHQGMIEAGMNWISGLRGNGSARFRHFLRIDFMQGINRFQIENLAFRKNDLIRGFDSRQISGKQRLNINLESVYFQRKDFYRFNIAMFTFVDLGILGQDNRLIFKESYYYGFGAGMRLHNESLVLKTVLIRVGVYPNHPNDVGLLGVLITEQTRQRFYDFQPGPPTPRKYE